MSNKTMTNTENALSTALERINSGEFEYAYKSHSKPMKSMTPTERAAAIEVRDEMSRQDHVQRQRVRQMLAELYGVTNHKNENKLWDLAWEHGHANGYNEVALCYDQFVTLLQ